MGAAPEVVRVPTAASVSANAARIRAALLASGRPALVIAHSKGGLEALAALLDPAFRGRPAPPVLAGLRVLHKGRHFRGGRDVYPALLDAASGKPAEAA